MPALMTMVMMMMSKTSQSKVLGNYDDALTEEVRGKEADTDDHGNE